jgi:hypothetical protein
MLWKDVIRNRETGLGVPSEDVDIKLESDDSLVGTATTDGDGLFTYTTDGFPGPVYYTVTSGGETKRHTSNSTGPSGQAQIGEWAKVMQVFGSGVLQDVDGELEVTADGVGMDVDVADGTAMVKGHQYTQYTNPLEVTISANASGNPRIDRIVVRATLTGALIGKTEIDVIEGSAAASPTPPALTRTADTWEISLAQVRVENGASSIAADKVTDERGDEDVCGWWGADPVHRPATLFERAIRNTTNYTAMSTTATDITNLHVNVTLAAGWTYDVIVVGHIVVRGNTAAAEAGIAVYAETESNISSYNDEDFGDRTHWRIEQEEGFEIDGDGSAITCGVKVKKVAGSVDYQRGSCYVIAVPR